jgi:hypothetical protein
MIDEERLHREVDGFSSPVESASLQEELRHDPLARQQLHELRALDQALRSVPLADPPAGLLFEVMREVRARARERSTADRSRASGLLAAAFARRPAFGLGLAFAAGLLAAAVSGALLSRAPGRAFPDASVVGTALPSDRLREIGQVALSGPGLRGHARARESGGQMRVQVEVRDGAPLALSLAWAGGAAEPTGFERTGPAGRVVLGPGTLEVQGAGAGLYEVRFAAGAAPRSVRVRLEKEGREAGADLELVPGS